MQSNKTIREKIIESSIIISSLLIFFGFLKQYWFYSFFGIKIQHFLSVEEVIIMFLGELPFVMKCILGATLYYIIIMVIFKIYCAARDGNNKLKDTEKEIHDTFEEFFNNRKHLIIAFGLSLIFFVICICIFNYNHSEFALIYLTLMFCQMLHILIDIFNLEVDEQLKHLTLLLLSLSILLYCKNIIDIEQTYKAGTIQCKLKEESVTVIKPYILIGKTKDYIFLYNKCRKTTKVIKVENFIDMEMQKSK